MIRVRLTTDRRATVHVTPSWLQRFFGAGSSPDQRGMAQGTAREPARGAGVWGGDGGEGAPGGCGDTQGRAVAGRCRATQ